MKHPDLSGDALQSPNGAANTDQPTSPRIALAGCGLLLFALFRWLLPVGSWPAAAGLDPDAVALGLGIFACVAFLWVTEAMPLAATSLLVPVLAILGGILAPKDAFAPFADPLILLFFGGFVVAAAMSRQGVDRSLALALVRMGGGSFIRTSVCLFIATAFISMWMNNTATTAMMLPMAMGILRHHAGGDRDTARKNFIVLGLAYAASIGGLGMIIGSAPNVIAAKELGLSFTAWMRIGLPVVILGMPLMIVILLAVLRPADVRIHALEAERTHHPGRKLTIAIFATTAACWLLGGRIGPLIGVTQSFDTVVGITACIALLLTRCVTWDDVQRTTEWSVLILFGGGIALSIILRETGTSLFLARCITMLTDDWPPFLMLLAVVAFVIFLTELMSNTTVAALLVPIFAATALETGADPARMILPVALAANCGFMMPIGTPPNAMVFASGQVTQRRMMSAGIWVNLGFVVLLSVLSWWLF
jgi:sodium-dependent dicarboxylate transporter 2/3/5